MTDSAPRPRRIVAAVSPGDVYYERVLTTAQRLARDGSLTLLSIHSRPIEWVRDQLRTPESQTADARREVARQIEADAARLGVTRVDARVPLAQRANVGDDIVEHAHELGATLIVLGTHGRRGLDAWVVGSVAEHVVRRAGCGVYVVRNRTTPPASA